MICLKPDLHLWFVSFFVRRVLAQQRGWFYSRRQTSFSKFNYNFLFYYCQIYSFCQIFYFYNYFQKCLLKSSTLSLLTLSVTLSVTLKLSTAANNFVLVLKIWRRLECIRDESTANFLCLKHSCFYFVYTHPTPFPVSFVWFCLV